MKMEEQLVGHSAEHKVEVLVEADPWSLIYNINAGPKRIQERLSITKLETTLLLCKNSS